MPLLVSVSSFDDAVDLIRDGQVRKVGVLLGAGISVSSGIKDYRSSDGMYNTLRPELYTMTPEQREFVREEASRLVGKQLFEESDGLPYLESSRDMLLKLSRGVYRPTFAHKALKALADKGVLHRVYTQNIDGFERGVGIPPELVREVHGSRARAICHYCREDLDYEWFLAQLESKIKDVSASDPSAPKESSPITCPKCGMHGPRPDVVLYGEALREDHMAQMVEDAKQFDLLLVIGTSLTVEPLSQLPSMTKCPRVVVGRTVVGEDVGLRYGRGRDVMVLADSDRAMHRLLQRTGWGSLEDEGEVGPLSMYPPEGTPTPGKRIEVSIESRDDLQRVIEHSREAAIDVPEVDLSSYETAGKRMTLARFLGVHEQQVRDNLQMVFGGGSADQIEEFLGHLRRLREGETLPWSLVIDDPSGESTVSSRDGDSPSTYRTVCYALTEKEKALMGVV
eukprot:Sspe_Gene.54876::Locus_30236_Transcript_2_3_Confidence_0.500_Length_1742::g.54876::m.54876